MKMVVTYIDRDRREFDEASVFWYIDGDGDLYIRCHDDKGKIISETAIARGTYLSADASEMPTGRSIREWSEQQKRFAKEKQV